MYKIIGKRFNKVYTLQEDGSMTSMFNTKPMVFKWLNIAKKYAKKILTGSLFNEVRIIGEDGTETEVEC